MLLARKDRHHGRRNIVDDIRMFTGHAHEHGSAWRVGSRKLRVMRQDFRNSRQGIGLLRFSAERFTSFCKGVEQEAGQRQIYQAVGVPIESG